MADKDINIWVDSTFSEPQEDSEEINVELQLASADNIGDHSIPVVYRVEEASLGSVDNKVEFFQETTVISGVINVPEEYFVYEPPKIEGIITSLIEFSASEKDNLDAEDIDIIYSSGYGTISGSFDKRIIFTAGKERLNVIDIPNYFYSPTTLSGLDYYWVNYANFSGNLTISGVPIPFYENEYDIIAEYFRQQKTLTSGSINVPVVITFSAWLGVPVTTDIYSVFEGYKDGYKFEVDTIDGGLLANYLDVYSSYLTERNLDFETYCSLVDIATINTDIVTTGGRIRFINNDVYSVTKAEKALTADISLYSIKFDNFSLNIGEYTTATSFISVDVLDDECPISTSGTYFLIDGTQVPVYFTEIENGYRMFYDPEDDFDSLEGPTTFTAHAENQCGDILEKDIYLTFGYIAEFNNIQHVMDYGFGNKIIVRVTAENYASCPKISSLAWDFDSREQFNNDLGASIVGRFQAYDYGDMPAEIYPKSTAYFYGKEFRIVLNVKDFAGNKMEPLILSYRIEDKPEN